MLLTFRGVFLTNVDDDGPQLIVGELAKAAQVRVAMLTGGAWQSTTGQSGKILTAYLRVPEDLGNKLAGIGGSKGIFTCVVAKHQ